MSDNVNLLDIIKRGKVGRFCRNFPAQRAVSLYASRMTFARANPIEWLVTQPRMPAWVTSGRAETPEDVGFLSGAALAHLHHVLARDEVPQALLRERLALRPAEACVRFSGRSEWARDLRDAVHLLRPGGLPGPAGGVYLAWRRAVERAVSVRALSRAVPTLEQEQIAMWLDAGQGRRSLVRPWCWRRS